jgi:hypothetical protein
MVRLHRYACTAIILIVLAFAASKPARAAGIYGTVYLYDLKTEEVKPADRLYRVEARMERQRVKTVSNADGTYRMYVGRRGEGEITLTHRGQRLTAPIDSRYYDRNYDLYIQYYEDRYRLIARSKRVRRPRPDTSPE